MPTVHIYDIENFNFSFSYSETNQENPDIQYYNTKIYRGNLGYNYVGNPKNVTPFGKAKWASKSYLALIKDINFYYLPKSITFNTEMNRNYSERLLRNKSGGDIIINPTYSKQWDWNRNFQFRYDLTKGLNLDYQAEAQAYVYEPAGNPDKGTEEWKLNRDTIKNELMHLGTMQRFHQTVNVNYTIPINKLPLLSWVTANASYNGQYFWTASALSIQNRLGNTIESSHSIQGSGNLDFTKIYNSIPYLKSLNTPASRRSSSNNRKQQGVQKGQTSDSTTMKPKSDHNFGKVLLDGSLKLVTMVKRASFTYSKNGGQVLPGFMPEPGYLGIFGTNGAPGWDFALGVPGDIFDKAISSGWITTDSILSDPYIRRNTENLSYRVNCEPFFGFKIDIQGNTTYTENFQQYFRANPYGIFEVFTPTTAGSYSASSLLIKTAFVGDYGDSNEGSPLFDQMLANRSVIADRIAKDNPIWIANVNEYVFDTIANEYFPKGYGASSNQVLLYSFLSAYSGQDASNIKLNPFQKIPFPNWSLTYNGLTNIPAIGAIFKTVNITHAYRSTTAISSWASNVYYDDNNPIQTYENSNNIIPKIDINQIVLNEQFAPLLGIDVGFQNSLTANIQYKQSRSLTMSFSNNQLTEVVGREIVVGAGYRIKGLKFNIMSISGGGNKKTVSNDLVLKVDLGFKKDKTTLRRVDENNSQVSAGQNKVNIYITGDYQFSTRLSAQVFFKRDMNTPFVSTTFPTATTFAGMMIRFNLAQ
jgi:cell surface protein SprA